MTKPLFWNQKLYHKQIRQRLFKVRKGNLYFYDDNLEARLGELLHIQHRTDKNSKGDLYWLINYLIEQINP